MTETAFILQSCTRAIANAELHLGWDNKKKRAANDRRVAIVVSNYVVIIRVRGTRADFVTVFVATGRTIGKIQMHPLWTQKNR